MKNTNKILLILTSITYLFFFALTANVTTEEIADGLLIKTEYGDVLLNKKDPQDLLLIQLIKHPVIERLKYIHQYGPSHFVKKNIVYAACNNKNTADYTRWEHSIGVFVLLRLFKATLEEQIAGLFHDSSHTVLSHVGCVLFKKNTASKTAYQDDVLAEFLNEHEVKKILIQNNINPENILIEKVPTLKRNSPDLCADNLEYTLKGGLLAGFIKPKDLEVILQNLKLNHSGKIWYFSSTEAAEKLAYASVHLSKTNSGSIWNAVLYKFTALAIQRALSIEILSKDDIVYNLGDDAIWQALAFANDTQITKLGDYIARHEETYQILEGESDSYDCLKISTKFRGINPLIEIGNNNLQRLTDVNEKFRDLFYGILYKHQAETTIRFTNGYAFLASAINALGGIKGQ